MQTDVDVAVALVVTPGTVLGLVLGGLMILAGLLAVVGMAVLADLNRTIKVIHQRDTPAR